MEYIDLTLENSGGGSTPKNKFGADIDVLIGDLASDGMLKIPQKKADLVFNGVKKIASQALMYKFKDTGVKTVSFPDLETLHTPSCCEQAFYNSGINMLSMPKLESIIGARALYEAFRGTSLISVEFPLLNTINGNYALQSAFERCLYFTNLSFPALTTVGNNVHQFTNMLNGVTGCTVHFPSAMQNVIGAWDDVTNGFGGTNTTVLFDL